jgi:hypothetical protein
MNRLKEFTAFVVLLLAVVFAYVMLLRGCHVIGAEPSKSQIVNRKCP